MNEWLDIVDELDQVIGRAPRDMVHTQQHRHRSSHIVVFNTVGEVFVQLRSQSKDNDPGLWDTSAAGHLDSGETYLECAVRELSEELGLIVTGNQLTQVGKLSADVSNGFEFSGVFILTTDQQLTLQKDEIDDGAWCTPDELNEWIASSGNEFTKVFKTIWHMIKTQASIPRSA